MPLLSPLTDWDSTREALHHAADIVANIQKAFSPTLPNALHLSLFVREHGLTTRPLSFGNLSLNFMTSEIVCLVSETETRFSLQGHSPRTLRAALLDHLIANGISGTEAVKPTDDDAPLVFDSGLGVAYMSALWVIYGVIARVRGDWMGAVTPMVVWPHGFDLSTLYFPGNIPDEHAQPHINVGFSPTSKGFPRPYIYAYVWPLPDHLTATPLPAPAHWTTDGWTGAVIDYDTLRDMESPQSTLENTLRVVFSRLSGAMN
jgi:hypothetical protein